MLEIRNLKKTYHSKKGGDTEALKGINLKFPDKGLIFILGKSGCGKSTFLNMLGGLDTFDEGEIIINGKSSNDFTKSDFDSYRNTYLGFVFQEFNIIETFTIEKNIGLALQLQHRKGDKEEIHEILKKVELEGFANRKPNELSGGQKQRVAIARALIKNPEIILADEPTGALDSATGKSVLNMLLKLSKEKLVIIVSHDREFAEEYADRIVELKDGVVISDRTRLQNDGEEKWRDEITQITSSIIRIPKGKPLDQQTIIDINESLMNSKTDMYLLLGEEDKAEAAYPQEMRAAIENGFTTSRSFKATDEREITSSKTAMKLIKSKLPLGDAIKIGASNFKSKKFRLILTIFLSIISLVFFGFADIFASYNAAETHANAYYEGDAYYMNINKVHKIREEYLGYHYDRKISSSFSNEDLEKLDEYFDGNMLSVYSFKSYAADPNFYKSPQDKFYYKIHYNGFLETKGNEDLVAYGRFPQNENEVMISDYMAKGYLDLSISVNTDSGVKEYVFDSYDQIIGHNLEVDGINYTISGIFKTNYYYLHNIISQYTDEQFVNDERAQLMREAYQSDMDMLYSKLIVGEGFSNHIKDNMTEYNANVRIVLDQMNNADRLIVKLDQTGRLKKGEAVIPAYVYDSAKYGWGTDHTYEDVASEFVNPQNITFNIPRTNGWWYIEDENEEIIYEKTFSVLGVYDNGYTNEGWHEEGEVVEKVEKVYPEHEDFSNFGQQYELAIYLSQEDFREIIDATYVPSSVLVSANTSGSELLRDIEYLDENDFTTSARYSSELSMVDELMAVLIVVFYIIAAVLAIFVILLLYNFISTSIVNKQKEIGILRAIGARGTDVAKIFIVESVIIGLIVIVFAIPIVMVASTFLQKWLLVAISIKLIEFKIRQVFTMSAITLFIVIISSIIPVARISRRKPIDAILNK